METLEPSLEAKLYDTLSKTSDGEILLTGDGKSSFCGDVLEEGRKVKVFKITRSAEIYLYVDKYTYTPADTIIITGNQMDVLRPSGIEGKLSRLKQNPRRVQGLITLLEAFSK